MEPSLAQRTAVVRFPKFADDDMIAKIHAAASVVRAEKGDVKRSNSLTGSAKEGSWSTVYLNSQLAQRLPDLRAKLEAAAREADQAQWGVMDALQLEDGELAMRCAEYHTVVETGGLPIPKHYDAGSLWTMDLMLSDTSEFDGGVFSTLEADGELKPHTFERGDLLVFLSTKYHCVTPLTRGTRQVLVCELWEGLERPCACRCEIPWGPCSCSLDSSRLHVRNQESKFTDFATVPFSYKAPLPIKRSWAATQWASGRWGPRPAAQGGRRFMPGIRMSAADSRLQTSSPSQAESEEMGLRDWPSTVVDAGGLDERCDVGAMRYVLEGEGTVTDSATGTTVKVKPNSLVRVLAEDGAELQWVPAPPCQELVLLTPEYRGPSLLPVVGGFAVACVALIAATANGGG